MTTRPPVPTAVVVGAGPAGSVAAALLARAGWRVTVVEQHTFPRDKVCGECLSATGMGVLRRLGVARSVTDAGAVELRRCILHAPDGTPAEVPLAPSMWGVSRRRLDALLLQEATASGAEVRQPVRCQRVAPGTVSVRDLRTNRVAEFRADWILIADGKGAGVGTRPLPTRDLGIKAHFENVAGDARAIELFGVHGHYGGTSPIENGLWNAAFSVPEYRVRARRGDLDRVFADVLRENVALARKFSAARRVGPWLASPLPRFSVSPSWPAGIIPLGNAAAAIEPVGGEGMGLAVRSAELAATSLIEAGADAAHPSIRRLPHEFKRLWAARPFACRVTALALSSPSLADAGMSLLSDNPRLATPLLAALGKR